MRIIVVITLVLFGALTAVAILNGGVTDIFASITSSWGWLQIFVDLVIALAFIMVWMWRDAKAARRNPWPRLVLTAYLLIGA